ncbi:calcium/sodium antiporter [Persicobacter psychrovividus]|uniref:Sodium:calcium antiporter n=1 Tax=Persicobacter psychrovividus TaxID=387638 RepID=A0ABN6L4J1_9BACT|nr:sodium:calcium antiporter [Persicobacter psychrovividus]
MNPMLINILSLIGGLVLLIAGGHYLVKGGSTLALRYKISPMVVGLTVIAFGTSAPELLVSVQAAFRGSPDLAMGNVVGSNICNLALVLGITALISPIMVDKKTMRIDWPVTFVASLLLFVLVHGGMLSLVEGAVLFAGLIAYLAYQMVDAKRNPHVPEEVAEVLEQGITGSIFTDLMWILVGGIGLYFGSDFFVGGAQAIALYFEVPERVVGLTVVALGTSLPELVTSVIAARKQQVDLALGNLLGSNIFNILCILGITSMIHPIHVQQAFISNDMIWMLAITLVVLPMMWLGKKISRVDGAILLGLYITYTVLVLV